MKFHRFGAILTLFALTATFWTPNADAGAYFAGAAGRTYTAGSRYYFYTRDLDFITSRPTQTAATTPSPAASPAPTATQTVPVSQKGEVAQMLAWINEDRAREGLSPLILDDRLTRAALSHSQDMAQGQYCSHTSPTKGGFSQRLSASGISTLGAGENVARYGNLEKAHAALMSSAGHRANLMNERYTHIGLGIVKDAKGVYYITQWIARMN